MPKPEDATADGSDPFERDVRPTHWKDDRGYVLTNAQREARHGDWKLAYNVPCKSGAFGRIVPLHKCGYCGGKGRDPESTHDRCPTCGRSGGLPGPNVGVKAACPLGPLAP